MLNKSGDIDIWQGANAPPVIWQFLKNDIPDAQPPAVDDLIDLTNSILFLTIGFRGTTLVSVNTRDNADVMAIDLVNATLTWNYTLAESRALPLGRLANYEIERRMGTLQDNLCSGFAVVSGGLNSD